MGTLVASAWTARVLLLSGGGGLLVRQLRHALMGSGGAVDIFNTGPGYTGLTSAKKVFGLAEVFGIQALLGSTVELSIGTSARAHLASAIPNIDYPCYPSGPLVYQEQICKERVLYEAGHIVVPDGPGVGVEIDEDKLRAQTLK